LTKTARQRVSGFRAVASVDGAEGIPLAWAAL